MTSERPDTIVHPAEHAPIRQGSLWFGIVAGPVAWTAQGLLGWYFGERICAAMSIGSVRLTLAAISLVALAGAVAGALTGWRNLRHAAAGPHPAHSEAWDRVEFMSLAGLLVSSAFVLGILWASLSSAMLSQCGRVR